MTVPHYEVRCQCGEFATDKIAARWSDGIVVELKTYALCCPGCLENEWTSALSRRANCHLTHGETLDEPSVIERSAE